MKLFDEIVKIFNKGRSSGEVDYIPRKLYQSV